MYRARIIKTGVFFEFLRHVLNTNKTNSEIDHSKKIVNAETK